MERSTFQKLLFLLSGKDKKSAVFLLFLLIIGMILEMFSLGLVIPMIVAITRIETITSNVYLAGILKSLGNPSQVEIIIFVLISIVVVYVLKTCFLLFLVWRQYIFSQSISMNLSRRLFDGYLNHSYTFHLQRNSSELYRNVLGEVDLFTSVTQAILLLQTNLSVFLGVFLSILLIEPIGALFIFGFILLFGLLYLKIIKKSIVGWGIKRQMHDVERSRHLMQGLGGVKDIKILGREKHFLSLFEYHNKSSFDIGVKVNVLQQAPRLLLELIAIFALSIFLFVAIFRGLELYLIIPVIGVFVAAAFRLIPAIGSVMSGFQTLRFANPVINLMYREINSFRHEISEGTPTTISFEEEIVVDNVSFKYESADSSLFKNINVKIQKNTTVGLIGESGAGKSTLVDIILGLLKPDNGHIKVDGVKIQDQCREWQNIIGYVPQNIYLIDDTIAKNIAFGFETDQIDREALQRAIDISQLNSFVNDQPDGIESIVGERGVRISGGQRQRIGIARALYHNPSVLVLDEATSALDIDTEKWVMEAINNLQHDKTIIIITHRLSTVERCDEVYKLDKGTVRKIHLSDLKPS